MKKCLDTRNFDAGRLTLMNRFSAAGFVYVGNLVGIDIFEYSGVVCDENGADIPLIRTDRIEMFSTADAARWEFFYGPVPDTQLVLGGNGPFVGRRFAKSWKEEDPAVVKFLLHSRPLPMLLRGDTTGSMKVV